MSVNPQRKLMCCENCGRDTTAATGYCGRCVGRGRQYVGNPKAHGRDPRVVNGTPVDEPPPEEDDEYIRRKEDDR